MDVLIVSLGSTGGLRAVDEELAGSLRRAGATVAIASPDPPSSARTLMLTDLRWARAARIAAVAELARTRPRALIYSTTTAALLWPRVGAIRFDAPAAGNRAGRHGLWQRPLERRRLHEAPLLLPQSEGALEEIPARVRQSLDPGHALVLPVPVEPSMPIERSGEAPTLIEPSVPVEQSGASGRDIAAITYAANPAKKGLDVVLGAWQAAHRPGEELFVVGVEEERLRGLGYALPAEGVRVTGMLGPAAYRALLRRARIFVCAARREDYGIAQLEALADGCILVSTASPGPYVALPIARELDQRLIGDDLSRALRTALDDPVPDYALRALRALMPLGRKEVDRLIAEQLLPRLLA
jgi:hypothetical protein